MTRDRNDGHAMQVEAPGAARVPRDFSRAGAPEAVEDHPTAPIRRIIGDSYQCPKARGTWVCGYLRGAAVYRSTDPMLTWRRINATP
jgi:hypothetical protein